MDAEINLAERRERAWERHCMVLQLIAAKEDVSLKKLDEMIAQAKREAEEDMWDRNL
jgi:hypothetical protein